MHIEFDTSQVARLAADLARAPAEVTTRVQDAVRDTASDVERDAAMLAPKLTGLLSQSVSGSGSGLSVTIDTDVRYAVYQEYGTSKMAANPFMGPALDMNAGPFADEVADAASDFL